MDKSKRQLKKHLETNENGSTTVQNPQDAAKAVQRGKPVVILASLKKKNLK